jgi:proteic killer suppression protein
MIRNFRDNDTRDIAGRVRVPRFSPELQRQAQKKLMVLNNAVSLSDLRVPPGNRLEALSGNRQGQYSIRINDQWRVCFVWRDGDANDVEIADYH